MGIMELYIYTLTITWNGLIAIQDLCNYYMNNVQRNLLWTSIFATLESQLCRPQIFQTKNDDR